MRLIKNALLLLMLILGNSCAPPPPEDFGSLQGHVTIGPLVPVMREGKPEPTPAPEVYSARQIVISSIDGQAELARVEINAQGIYQVSLPVGEYFVDINRLGIDSAAGLPTTIQIDHQQVTTLDIDIDTGIR